MNRRLLIGLGVALLLALIAALTFGEVGLSLGQYTEALTDPGSPAGRAPLFALIAWRAAREW
ncbi:MAG: hypothetical protein EON88_30410, partial [Brevundimonas sp.]